MNIPNYLSFADIVRKQSAERFPSITAHGTSASELQGGGSLQSHDEMRRIGRALNDAGELAPTRRLSADERSCIGWIGDMIADGNPVTPPEWLAPWIESHALALHITLHWPEFGHSSMSADGGYWANMLAYCRAALAKTTPEQA